MILHVTTRTSLTDTTCIDSITTDTTIDENSDSENPDAYGVLEEDDDVGDSDLDDDAHHDVSSVSMVAVGDLTPRTYASSAGNLGHVDEYNDED